MAKRRSTGSVNLFTAQDGVIPMGFREICAGCDKEIDLRVNGWAPLASRTFVHGGEPCWRAAVNREIAKSNTGARANEVHGSGKGRTEEARLRTVRR